MALSSLSASAQTVELWATAIPPDVDEGHRGMIAMPDQTGDGWPEVWVLAHSVDLAYWLGTWRFLVLDGMSGTLLRETPLPAHGFSNEGRLLAVPDVNSDGYPELLVGQCFETTESFDDPGFIVLVDGWTGTMLNQAAGPGPKLTALGHAMCLVGDVSGDGYPEVAVSDPAATTPAGKHGLVHIWDVKNWQELPQFLIENTEPLATNGYKGYGANLAALGDVNDDGDPEIAISESNAGTLFSGRVEVRSVISGANVYNGYGSFAFGWFGSGLDAYPDIDGDGELELAIGESFLVPPGAVVRIVSPNGWNEIDTIFEPNDSTMLGVAGNADEIGDVNGDGVTELFANAWGTHTCIFSGTDPAAITVVDSKAAEVIYQVETPCGVRLGDAATLLGDVDGTGWPVYAAYYQDASGASIRAYRLQLPRTYSSSLGGGACKGLSIGWKQWLPNFQGFTTTLTLSHATPLQQTLLLFSVDPTQWAGIPMPLDLSAFGAPGCALLVPPDIVFPALADALGNAQRDIVLSTPDPAAYGLAVYSQWAGYTAANPLSLATSDALELTLLP